MELFEKPAYQETFHGVEYLHALALIRLGKRDEAKKSLDYCLHYYPLVAKYLLDPSLLEPPNEDRFGGVVSGSELEGWIHALQFGHLWRMNQEAMELLRQESKPNAQNNWKRWDRELKAERQAPGPDPLTGEQRNSCQEGKDLQGDANDWLPSQSTRNTLR